jgi:hypothetical protein
MVQTVESPLTSSQELYRTTYYRVKMMQSARRLWERILSEQDRQALGNDLRTALITYGNTVGIWQRIKGTSTVRATIDLGLRLNFLTSEDHAWLLRESGEVSADPEQTITQSIETHMLVLRGNPLEAYWRGEEIQIDWVSNSKLANYFWELAKVSKASNALDSTKLGERYEGDYVSKIKHRLTSFDGFPPDLADCIVGAGRGTQVLNIPPAQIRIYESETIEICREYLP